MNRRYTFVSALIIAFGLLFLSQLTVINIGTVARAQADPAAPANAEITVAHFAPFATTVEDTAVAVVVNGGVALSETVFGQVDSGISLPAGTYTVALVPKGTITPALTAQVPVSDDMNYTVAAIGGANGWPLELLPLVNDTVPSTTSAKVRITHLSPFSTTLEGTQVDICVDGGGAIPGLTDIPYKASSPYLALPAGIYDLLVAVAGTDCSAVALDVPPFELRNGQIVDVVAIGLPGDPELPLQLWTSGLSARVAVGHFAPFASEIISTSVTVRVNGTDLLTGFRYGDLTGYDFELPLGTHTAEVFVEPVPEGTLTPPAITGTLNLTGFLDYTMAAIGDVVNQPLELIQFLDSMDSMAVSAATDGGVVRIAHLAPFADNLPGTEVDICPAIDADPLLSDVPYKASATIPVNPVLYQLFASLGADNCSSKLFDIPPFVGAAGETGFLYAIGNVVNFPPTARFTDNLTPEQIFLPIVTK